MIIERKEYLEKLIAWKDKQLIKIVTGVRRCGKSMLLEIYRNYLKEHGIEEQHIFATYLALSLLSTNVSSVYIYYYYEFALLSLQSPITSLWH